MLIPTDTAPPRLYGHQNCTNKTRWSCDWDTNVLLGKILGRT